MTCFKKLMIASVILLAIGYVSKPDRGGVGRCSEVFAMPGLKQFQLSHRPFLWWELFESPKFRFTISPSDFSRLEAALKSAGYSGWERGGVTFGSVSHGWETDEDYVTCEFRQSGHHYYWSYSPKGHLIYAITSQM